MTGPKILKKCNSFLKRNLYPEFKPSRQIKYKPSEADLKARAEEALILRPVRLVLFLLILTTTSKKNNKKNLQTGHFFLSLLLLF